jgi:sec-independent protein translocase protein TatB
MLPDVGGTELILIAAVALIVVGPKDLPVLMRKVGQAMGRMRAMAADFRASFDDMARQSELDELRKEIESMRAERVDPVGWAADSFKGDLVEPWNDPDADLALPAAPETAAAQGSEVSTPGSAPKPKAKRARKAATALAASPSPASAKRTRPRKSSTPAAEPAKPKRPRKTQPKARP